MKNVRRVCYAGTYEREYPRNTLVIRALRDAGVAVEECHVPVFERARDKGSLSTVALAGLALRLMFAYLRLIPDVGLRLLRCDALVTGYIGQIDTFVLATVARIAGKPVIFNPLVSLTDTLVEDRKQFAQGSLPARMIWNVDRLSMKMADIVLADTDANARYFVETFGLEPGRVAVVHVGALEDVFFPAGVEQRERTCLDVLFVGKFIPLHGIATILDAARLLQDRNQPVQIEMVGQGQEYAAARAQANRLGLTNIVWTDWIPFDELGDRLRRADVVLGIFDAGPKAARVIPNKVHHALACAAPLVTRQSPAMAGFLQDGESARLVPPADPVALADAIDSLLDARLRLAVGQAGHQAWRTWGSRAALAGQMQFALDRLAAVR